jgi:diguanylate cyclase (GGDEF)-like protein
VIRAEESERKLSSIDRSVEVEVKKRMLELENMNKKLLDISKTDALSNVLNKAAILKAMDRLINDKSNSKFSILMFDIDDFKNINDTHGHFVGDKCIRTLSSTARKSFRDIDLVGRYGGDEFIIILPDTGSKQALIVAERFRKTVAESSSPSITISIGIASYPLDGTNIGNLIKVADKGLYASKKKGKNTISHNSEV